MAKRRGAAVRENDPNPNGAPSRIAMRLLVAIVLETRLEDIPEPSPCEVCFHPTQKTFLHHVSIGADISVRARRVAGYRCQDPDCGVAAYSNEGLIEALTKAAKIHRDHGDFKTAAALLVRAETERAFLEGESAKLPQAANAR